MKALKGMQHDQFKLYEGQLHLKSLIVLILLEIRVGNCTIAALSLVHLLISSALVLDDLMRPSEILCPGH